jgi:hypothetical protein
VWSADLVEVSSTGGGYFVWGEDPFATEFDRVSGPRPLGRGGALGVLPDGTVIRSVDPAVVEQSLAASSGEARSLVDDASYAAAADTLDASGVYSAMLTSENITIDPLFLLGPLGGEVPTAEEVEEKLDSIVTLPPYLALGIGNKIDPDADPQGVLVVVVVAANAEAAQETITAMEAIVATGTSIAFDAPWSDLLTVSATEAKGSVAIIEFQTENPRIGISAYLQRDTLFVSG